MLRLPHAVALAAGYADEFFSKLTGREPQIPVEGVKMSRHKMFVASDKAESELGYKPGPVEAALERAVRWYEEHGYVRGGGGIKRVTHAAAAWSMTRQICEQSSHPMKVLVTFALENEFAPWRGGRDFRPGKWGGADVYVAKFGAAEVGVLLTGAGPKQARAQVSKIFRTEDEPMNFCVSSGLAGALRAEYQVGQVLGCAVGISGRCTRGRTRRPYRKAAARYSPLPPNMVRHWWIGSIAQREW